MKNEVDTSGNNKLIAEFLEWELREFKGTLYITSLEGNVYTNLEDLQFHTDWNDLMQVVEKIESLDHCQIDISLNWCRIGYKGTLFNYDSRDYFKGITKIEAVYNACVKFIKWYNENAAKR